MALISGFPSGDGLTTHAEARKDFAGLVTQNAAGKLRGGVFYRGSDLLVQRRSDMRLNVPAFTAVQDKQGACFIAGEGTTTTPAFAAAPSANRRIDLLYLTQLLPAIDSATGPQFRIVTGQPSPNPVPPSLPAIHADAIPWATVEIPAGATSMNSDGVVITPVYPFTAAAGGTVVVRSVVELEAWAPADGARAYCLADGRDYVRRNGVWGVAGGTEDFVASLGTGWSWYAGHERWLRKDANGLVHLCGTLQIGSGAAFTNMLTLPVECRPRGGSAIGGVVHGSAGYRGLLHVSGAAAANPGRVQTAYGSGSAGTGSYVVVDFSWFV